MKKNITQISTIIFMIFFVFSVKAEQKQLSESEISSILDDTNKILSRPVTAGSQKMISFNINTLAKAGNTITPYIKSYINHNSINGRKFAIDLLSQISTEESLSLICDKFWSTYNSSQNTDKITATTASLAYHHIQLNSNISGANEYWEARYIFKKMIENNAKCLDDLSVKIANDNNGIAVMATKYLWKNKGELYRDKFLNFSNSIENTEVFFTFLDEFMKIYENNKNGEFAGIEKIKNDLKIKLTSLVKKDDIKSAIFVKGIKYLNIVDPVWFTNNWVEVYKQHRNKSDWWQKRAPIVLEVSNNELAKQNLIKLKNILPVKEYELLGNSINENIERKIMIRKHKKK